MSSFERTKEVHDDQHYTIIYSHLDGVQGIDNISIAVLPDPDKPSVITFSAVKNMRNPDYWDGTMMLQELQARKILFGGNLISLSQEETHAQESDVLYHREVSMPADGTMLTKILPFIALPHTLQEAIRSDISHLHQSKQV